MRKDLVSRVTNKYVSQQSKTKPTYPDCKNLETSPKSLQDHLKTSNKSEKAHFTVVTVPVTFTSTRRLFAYFTKF